MNFVLFWLSLILYFKHGWVSPVGHSANSPVAATVIPPSVCFILPSIDIALGRKHMPKRVLPEESMPSVTHDFAMCIQGFAICFWQTTSILNLYWSSVNWVLYMHIPHSGKHDCADALDTHVCPNCQIPKKKRWRLLHVQIAIKEEKGDHDAKKKERRPCQKCIQ